MAKKESNLDDIILWIQVVKILSILGLTKKTNKIHHYMRQYFLKRTFMLEITFHLLCEMNCFIYIEVHYSYSLYKLNFHSIHNFD